MGKKEKKMEECVPQATALHEYIQETLIPRLDEMLPNVTKIDAEKADMDKVQ
jgi:hypothetical protein